jgi:hypothetical protein
MEQKDWIILAVVCGVIAMVYMQQQKPALVFPPVKQENFTEPNDIYKDMYEKGSEWLSGYMLPTKKEKFSQPDLETQLFLLHARIFSMENPKYGKRVGEWIRSMVTDKPQPGVFSIHPEQLEIADENNRKYIMSFRNAGFRN